MKQFMCLENIWSIHSFSILWWHVRGKEFLLLLDDDDDNDDDEDDEDEDEDDDDDVDLAWSRHGHHRLTV